MAAKLRPRGLTNIIPTTEDDEDCLKLSLTLLDEAKNVKDEIRQSSHCVSCQHFGLSCGKCAKVLERNFAEVRHRAETWRPLSTDKFYSNLPSPAGTLQLMLLEKANPDVFFNIFEEFSGGTICSYATEKTQLHCELGDQLKVYNLFLFTSIDPTTGKQVSHFIPVTNLHKLLRKKTWRAGVKGKTIICSPAHLIIRHPNHHTIQSFISTQPNPPVVISLVP